MPRRAALITSLILCFVVSISPASAQLPPAKKDPLSPAQNSQAAGCSTTEASSCAQAAAKILPIVMGPRRWKKICGG